MATETSQTLDRGLRVLAILAATPRGMTMTALAGQVGVSRTVVYRLVATLEQHALARRDHAGLVHVGLGMLPLARGLHPVLRELAAPVLRSLAEELGTTAHLTIADGGEALAVAVVEPTWTDFHVGYRVGARHALGQGAAGRAILLGREEPPEDGAAESAGLAGSAAGSAGSAAGWVVTVGELQAGARGVAAPVRVVDGLEASVGIVTLGELDEERVGPRVVLAAAELITRLA